MDINKDFEELLNDCGGEDLIRYLLKEDGVHNWETVELHPIVVYSPSHMDSAEIGGICYWNGGGFSIVHSECLYESDNLNLWIESIMNKENFEYEVEAFFHMNRAIVATPQVIDYSESKTWERIVLEVMYGYRSNNFNISISNNTKFDGMSSVDSIANFFDILLDVKENLSSMKRGASLKNGPDFSEDFKHQWA